MTNRFEAQARERELLADRLAAEYASGLPQTVTQRAFSLAWENGHAHGEGEVEAHFIDLMDIATEAYRAGRGA